MALENTIKRDFLLTLLFTGLRKTNCKELRWEHIDLGKETLYIPRTKGGKDFTLPLSDYLVELLTQRKKENLKLFPRSGWVFPGHGKTGHIADPEPDGYMLHDLRRTFATTAEPIVSTMQLKKFLNHKLPESDITANYVNPNTEALRQPMQAVTDRLLQLCRPAPEGGKVVPIKGRKQG